jgi:hypothetical protein
MARDISKLCQEAQERCEQALELHGDERRLYLNDAINKIIAAVDMWMESQQ